MYSYTTNYQTFTYILILLVVGHLCDTDFLHESLGRSNQGHQQESDPHTLQPGYNKQDHQQQHPRQQIEQQETPRLQLVQSGSQQQSRRQPAKPKNEKQHEYQSAGFHPRDPRIEHQQELTHRRTARNVQDEIPMSRFHFIETRALPIYKKLQYVGNYLRYHKYYDSEQRPFLAVGDDKDAVRTFMSQFPVPLKNMFNPFCEAHDLEMVCKANVTGCLNLLVAVAHASPVAKIPQPEAINPTDINNLLIPWPLNNRKQQMEFRLTASYYMCWYTLQRHPDLRHFEASCQEPGLLTAPHQITKDVRAVDAKPFSCALASFCPDPCCGKIQNGLIDAMHKCLQSPSNPCHGIAGGTCNIDFKRNHNFDDLLQPGKLNYTCYCKKGYMTDTLYRECVDEDECQQGTYTCKGEHETCLSTLGSYQCVCKYGYLFNETSRRCVEDTTMLFRPSAIRLKSLEHSDAAKKDSPLGKISKMIHSVFSSNSAESTAPPCTVLSLQLLLILCNYFCVST